MSFAAPDVARMFTAGEQFAFPSGQLGTVLVTPPVELSLPSGRIVACDPFTGLGAYGGDPFTVTVPPGRYQVTASMLEITAPEDPESESDRELDHEPEPEQPHRRVAAARLVISDQPVAVWEQAVVPEQDLGALGEDEFYGYGVDAGTGCFVDAEAVEPLGDFESDTETLMAAFEAVEWSAGVVTLTAPESGHNLVAFSSGWGDGVYPTWIGRTASGEVACLVTEFFVIPDDRSDHS
ncbi:DUF4241 domain-containing protein [Streptacidiphilus sp. P02-A3a]|uniref:DUF4241 domain-containing protein n=1 Tax=Streptacidiphilus sp. P02-A3a TaxID=2704468 RepID=UPI0015FB5B3D|nr:DUF4241 domain-containing protein [Streptacidiphilus sp. P02-A3a]QMU71112.1 DUF4241 domain-containing protein [Streptacidiphilus sp. P02-A3a]